MASLNKAHSVTLPKSLVQNDLLADLLRADRAGLSYSVVFNNFFSNLHQSRNQLLGKKIINLWENLDCD